MEDFIIRRMQPGDIPSAHALAVHAGLTKSRPPDVPSRVTIMKMMDLDQTLCLVATPINAPLLVISSAMICCEATWHRSEIARLEAVATMPDFERNGLAIAIICRLLWFAEHMWGCTSMQWTCEDLPVRQNTRAWYRRQFLAVNIGGSPGEFIVKFPWTPLTHQEALYFNHLKYGE